MSFNKEDLSKKIEELLQSRVSSLENKFLKDISTLEDMKYDYFDNIHSEIDRILNPPPESEEEPEKIQKANSSHSLQNEFKTDNEHSKENHKKKLKPEKTGEKLRRSKTPITLQRPKKKEDNPLNDKSKTIVPEKKRTDKSADKTITKHKTMTVKSKNEEKKKTNNVSTKKNKDNKESNANTVRDGHNENKENTKEKEGKKETIKKAKTIAHTTGKKKTNTEGKEYNTIDAFNVASNKKKPHTPKKTKPKKHNEGDKKNKEKEKEKEEKEKLEKERLERERLEKERIEKERLEIERIEKEAREKAEREAREKAEREEKARIAKEKKEREEREAREKAEREKKAREEAILKKINSSKPIFELPSQIKNNKKIEALYCLSKTKYLPVNDKVKMIKSIPNLYKALSGKLSFLLEEKIDELNKEAEPIRKEFNNYQDVSYYIDKNFTPTKTALNSLVFLTREEELNLIKKDNLPKEIGDLFRFVFYILDIDFDENITANKLVENLINIVFPKFGVKDFKGLFMSFQNGKNTFKMNKEKFQKIENLVKRSPKILSNIDMGKINRPISYMIFYLKEIFEFFNLKTEDGVYYFELKEKNETLKAIEAKIDNINKALEEHKGK
ncbi:MAG: hypothetical protein MJ252_11550 [archaeon]|nr:hypothetical protein [archaeon]